jgi:hypothetical protein
MTPVRVWLGIMLQVVGGLAVLFTLQLFVSPWSWPVWVALGGITMIIMGGVCVRIEGER